MSNMIVWFEMLRKTRLAEIVGRSAQFSCDFLHGRVFFYNAGDIVFGQTQCKSNRKSVQISLILEKDEQLLIVYKTTSF